MNDQPPNKVIEGLRMNSRITGKMIEGHQTNIWLPNNSIEGPRIRTYLSKGESKVLESPPIMVNYLSDSQYPHLVNEVKASNPAIAKVESNIISRMTMKISTIIEPPEVDYQDQVRLHTTRGQSPNTWVNDDVDRIKIPFKGRVITQKMCELTIMPLKTLVIPGLESTLPFTLEVKVMVKLDPQAVSDPDKIRMENKEMYSVLKVRSDERMRLRPLRKLR